MRIRPIAILILSMVFLPAAYTGCAILERSYGTSRPFLRYSVALKDGDLKVITVRGRVYGAAGKKVFLRVPEPGGSGRFEPIGLCASDDRGTGLDIVEETGGWMVENRGRDFTVTYDLVLTIEDRYAPDIRGMLTFLEEDRCCIKCGDIFILPDIPVAEGILVDIGLFPSREIRSSWRSVGRRMIVPSLEDVPSTMAVSGSYRFLGSTAGGVDLAFAIAGDWSFGDEEFFDVIRRVVSREVALFGSSPRESYLFVCDRNPVRGGDRFDYYGVHFGGNMVLLLDRRLGRSELFDTPMSIIAHEFFHNWNGDAVKPRSDDFLWFTEGVTVYYSYQILLDLNIIIPDQYGRKRRVIVERYRGNPYLEDVSIGSAANSDLSDKDMVTLLYDGGFLAAEAIDKRLSEITAGRVRLIDVLRKMYEDAGGVEGVDESTLLESIMETSGYDLTGFIGELIHEPAPAVLISSPI